MKRPKKLPRGVFIKNPEDGLFWIRYADQHGKVRREMSGPFLEKAKRAVEKRRSEVREGKFFPEKIRQRSVLFAEIAKDYLTSLRAGRKRDKAHDEQRMPVLLEALKDEPIGELAPARLDAVLAELGEENEWAPATHNRYRALLSGIFRQAIRNKKALFNPVRETKHFKEFPRERFLSEEEQTELMAAIRRQCPEREAEVLVAIHSGMRRSEQYRTSQVPDGGLKWEYINFRAGVIRWPRTKSGKPRTVPMNSVLTETLRAIPQRIDSPYVFEGEPDKWFAEVCDSGGVKNFTWHGLRHTFGSRLAQDGVPLKAIKDLMGHSSIQVTERYAHLQPGHLADAVERLAHPQRAKAGVQSDTPTDTSQNLLSDQAVKKAG
jgi:integrase